MKNVILLMFTILFLSCSLQEDVPTITIDVVFPEDLMDNTYQILYSTQDPGVKEYIIFARGGEWKYLGFGIDVKPPVDRGYKITEYSPNNRVIVGECNTTVDGGVLRLGWLDTENDEVCTLMDIDGNNMKVLSSINGDVEWIKVE